MKLFLVEGIITISEYMNDGYPHKKETLRLVWAKDESEASSKFIGHFEDKTVKYSTYYDARITEVSEAI